MTDIRTEIETLAHKAGVVADWGLGNPARKPSEFAIKVRNRAQKMYGNNFYAPTQGMPCAQKSVAKMYRTEKVELDWSTNVLISSFGTRIFPKYVLEAMNDFNGNSGRKLVVFIPRPSYSGHISAINRARAQCHYLDCTGRSFADAVADEVGEGVYPDMILASSVYNPTGEVTTYGDMEKLVAINQERGSVLFVDGAYRHLYYHGPISSILSVPDALEGRVVESLSMSKGHQWPDLKAGALVGSAKFIAAVTKVMGDDSDGGSRTAQLALAACVEDEQYLPATRLNYKSLMGFMLELLWEAGWTEVKKALAGIFLWPRIPQVFLDNGLTSNDFCLQAARYGVIMYPDSMFDGDGTRLRLCMRGRKRNIRKACSLIGQIINNLAAAPAVKQIRA